MGWLSQRNTRIELQRARNANQGRPVYRGTGKKKGGCPLAALLAVAAVVAHSYTYVQIGGWVS